MHSATNACCCTTPSNGDICFCFPLILLIFYQFSWFSYQFSWFSTNSLDSPTNSLDFFTNSLDSPTNSLDFFLPILLILLLILLIFTNSLDSTTNSLDSPTDFHREQNGLKPRLTLKSAKLLGRPSRQLRNKEEGSSPLTTTDWDSGCCSNQKSLRTDHYPGGPCRTRNLWHTTSTQKIG